MVGERRYSTGALETGIPDPSLIFVDKTGRLTRIAYQLVNTIYERTGGSRDSIYEITEGTGAIAGLTVGNGLNINTTASTLNADVLTVFQKVGNVGIEDTQIAITTDTNNDYLVFYDASAAVSTTASHKRITPINAGFIGVNILDEGVTTELNVRNIDFVGSAIQATSTTSGNVTLTFTPQLEILDEGTTTVTGVETIDFVGTAITVTSTTSGKATVTVAEVGGIDGVTLSATELNGDLAYSVVVDVGASATSGDKLEVMLFNEGLFETTVTTAATDQTVTATFTSGANGIANNVHTIVNLVNASGVSHYTVADYAVEDLLSLLLLENGDSLLLENGDFVLLES